MKSLLDEAPPAAPDWTMTYGDLMSLLLTFFVMLVSMSEMRNTDKYRGVADALQERFSMRSDATGAAPGIGRARNERLAFQTATARATRRELLEDLKQAPPAMPAFDAPHAGQAVGYLAPAPQSQPENIYTR